MGAYAIWFHANDRYSNLAYIDWFDRNCLGGMTNAIDRALVGCKESIKTGMGEHPSIQIEFLYDGRIGCLYTCNWPGVGRGTRGWMYTPQTEDGVIEVGREDWNDTPQFRDFTFEVSRWRAHNNRMLGNPEPMWPVGKAVRRIPMNPIYSKPHPFFSR